MFYTSAFGCGWMGRSAICAWQKISRQGALQFCLAFLFSRTHHLLSDKPRCGILLSFSCVGHRRVAASALLRASHRVMALRYQLGASEWVKDRLDAYRMKTGLFLLLARRRGRPISVNLVHLHCSSYSALFQSCKSSRVQSEKSGPICDSLRLTFLLAFSPSRMQAHTSLFSCSTDLVPEKGQSTFEPQGSVGAYHMPRPFFSSVFCLAQTKDFFDRYHGWKAILAGKKLNLLVLQHGRHGWRFTSSRVYTRHLIRQGLIYQRVLSTNLSFDGLDMFRCKEPLR